MLLKVDLVASVAKDVQRQDLNEDAYALGDTIFSLADGASESYDSQSWARLLTKAYLLDQDVGVPWVADKVRTYVEASDFDSLSWSQQAAFERGSFSTLVGLKWAATGGDVEVLAIGDSLAVHVRDGRMLASFPFEQAAQFDARPRLLSTLTEANSFVEEADFVPVSNVDWAVQPGDQILLVTDAVGHWLLAHDDALGAVVALSTSDDFERLIVARRLDKSMRLDDSTILRLTIESGDQEVT